VYEMKMRSDTPSTLQQTDPENDHRTAAEWP
jgi:hypothetical protein